MQNSLWPPEVLPPDSFVLFRAHFLLSERQPVEIRLVGSSSYVLHLDGACMGEGPARYALCRPESHPFSAVLGGGRHVLAIRVNWSGVETRILKDTPPFIWCEVLAGGIPLNLEWRCMVEQAHASGSARINPQLGWIECRDTRKEIPGWDQKEFDDSAWDAPVSGASDLPDPQPADLAEMQQIVHPLCPMAKGRLATTFGYPTDDPAYVFFSRDRRCRALPAKGVWRRYDLGRVRLGRPRLTLDVPAGTVVEVAMAEALTEGRVSPCINLSAGRSCNLDRFIARGGRQTFCPDISKGGRYLEVHVPNAKRVRFLEETFMERTYHPPTGASFTCGDPLLERIWMTGVETYRACAEDALIDNPTRERGQWVGDAASVGVEIASVAFHDLRLCKRALVQAALCPREDGVVAGMSPGGCVYLPTYAFQWAVAVMRYFQLTGDKSLLAELWEPALRNMQALRAFWHEDGLHEVAGSNFVDWGYRQEDGPVDTACNLHYLWSLRAMGQWAHAMDGDPSSFEEQAATLAALLRRQIAGKISSGGWAKLGYHAAALALSLKLIDEEGACLDYLQSHILDCFPNDLAGPRNDDPQGFCPRLITPYFAHYVMPLFIERGRMEFVLDQFRTCWGWMLDQGVTTWLEVFDTRWSHCHQWSGCPTWQLSRYLLGLHPRFDAGPAVFDFLLVPATLPAASGRIPHPSGGWVDISWQRTASAIDYRLTTSQPLILRLPGELERRVESSLLLSLPRDQNVPLSP